MLLQHKRFAFTRSLAAGVLSGMLLALAVTSTVMAQSSTPVSITPETTTVDVLETFEVDVQVGAVSEVQTFAADILYDPSIVKLVDAMEGDWMSEGGSVETSFQVDVSHEQGQAVLAVSRLDGGELNTSGDGVAVALTFEAVALGTSMLELSEVGLLKPNGNLAHTPELNHGEVEVAFPPDVDDVVFLSFDPETSTHDLLQSLEVAVVAGPMHKVHAVGTDIKFDPAVLSLESIEEGNVLNEGGEVSTSMQKWIDEEEGRAVVGISRLSDEGVSTSEPATLMILTFEARGLGSSALVFEDAGLMLPNGTTAHVVEVEDGGITVDWPYGPAVIEIDPEDATLARDEEVTFTVSASNVEALFGYGTDFSFSMEDAEVLQVQKGGLLSQDGQETLFDAHVDEENGTVVVGESRNGSGAGGISAAGPTTLFQITVQATDPTTIEPVLTNFGLTGTDGLTSLPFRIEGDTIPPARPTGFVAERGEEQVNLSWQANMEGDLEGYHVYRSTEPFGVPEQATRINESLLSGTQFTDVQIVDGATYYYRMTAVDYNGNESGASALESVSFSSGVGTFRLLVNNVPGGNPLAPGSDARVELRDGNTNQVVADERTTDAGEGVGEVIFRDVEPGTYQAHVFHNPEEDVSFWGREYWGRTSNLSIQADEVLESTFTRTWPYLKRLTVTNSYDEEVGPGSIVPVGEELTFEIELDHSLGATQTLTRLLVDRASGPPYDFDFEDSVTFTTGETGILEATFTPEEEGLYQRAYEVRAGADEERSDTSGWNELFTVQGTADQLHLSVLPEGTARVPRGYTITYELEVADWRGNPEEAAVVAVDGEQEWLQAQSDPTDAEGQTTIEITVPEDAGTTDFELTFKAEKEDRTDSTPVEGVLTVDDVWPEVESPGVVIQLRYPSDITVDEVKLVTAGLPCIPRPWVYTKESTITPHADTYEAEFLVWGPDELDCLIGDSRRVEELRVYDQSDDLVAKIEFSGLRLTDDKTLNAIVQIEADPRLQPDPDDIARGWKYYEGASQMPAFMLVPPSGVYSEIDPTRRPVLFVHGVGGKYAYWDSELLDAIGEERDVWQFYYPFDQRIDKSGSLLKKALTELLDRYPSFDKVDLVAHSMGGLVTRSYLQGQQYDFDVSGLLMLGTPNHGSLGAARLALGDPVSGFFVGLDAKSPAQRQMTPGSGFLADLNSKDLIELDNGIESDYLVLGGTASGIAVSALHVEIPDMDDGVVSLPSASLANLGVPIVTSQLAHSSSAGFVSFFDHMISDSVSDLVSYFISDGYNPHNIGLEFSKSESLFVGGEEVFGSPSFSFLDSIEGGKWGMLSLAVDGLSSDILTCINMYELPDGYLRADLKSLRSSEACSSNFLIGSFNDIGDTGYNFFQINKRSKLDRLPHLGIDSKEGYYEFCVNADDRCFTRIDEQLYFSPTQASMWSIDLRRAEVTILNAPNRIPTSPPLARSSNTAPITGRENRDLTTRDLFVDAGSDSLVVWLAGFEESDAAEDPGFQLVSPSGTIIDEVAAGGDGNVDYASDAEIGSAYYFLANPESGEWAVQYDAALTDVHLAAPVIGDVYLRLVPADADSLYEAGNTIEFTAELSTGTICDNPEVDAELFLRPAENGASVSLGSVDLTQNGDSFAGSFVAEDDGAYQIAADLACAGTEPVVRREARAFVGQVGELADEPAGVEPPEVVAPINPRNMALGGTPFEQNLNAVFSDPQGETLNYQVESSSERVAAASVDGARLQVEAIGVGSATVTVQATNVSGLSESHTFNIDVQQLALAVQQPFASVGETSSYRLAGLPGQIDADLAETLTGEPGGAWRAFRETGAAAEEGDGSEAYLDEYDGSDAFRFAPGRGFWLLSRDAWEVDQTVDAVDLTEDGLTTVPLHEGWNILSNPLDRPVDWASTLALTANDGLTEGLWQWDGGWQGADTLRSARAGEAYYLFNDGGLEALTLQHPAFADDDEQGDLLATTQAERAELELIAETRSAMTDERQEAARLALGHTAGDAIMHRLPPAHFAAAQLSARAEALDVPLGRLLHAQPEAGEGLSFDLTLTGIAEGEAAYLYAEGLAAFEGEEIVLVNSATGARHDLSAYSTEEPLRIRIEEGHLTRGSNEREEAFALQLLIGDQAFVDSAAERPDKLAFSAVYPNPSSGVVTVEVAVPEAMRVEVALFNVLGQQVGLLHSGELAPGVHELRWNGHTATGAVAASGVYLVRLTGPEGQQDTTRLTRVR